jgi:hypothetical protein
MAKFKDLNLKSFNTLKPHIEFWGDNLDLELSIDHKFGIHTTDNFRYFAEYAITYAVLLDDKALTEDLCKHGVNLNIRDRYHSDKSPLEIAIEYGRAGIVAILMHHGAQVPPGIKVPSSKPCSHPLTFFWTLNERANKREADFKTTDRLVSNI